MSFKIGFAGKRGTAHLVKAGSPDIPLCRKSRPAIFIVKRTRYSKDDALLKCQCLDCMNLAMKNF